VEENGEIDCLPIEVPVSQAAKHPSPRPV